MFGGLLRWFWWSSGRGRTVVPPITNFECDFTHTIQFETDFEVLETVECTLKFTHVFDMTLDYDGG